MIHPPSEPSGSGSAAAWFRDFLRFAKSLRVKDSPHIQVTHTTDGITLALRRALGGGGGPATNLEQYLVKVVHDDHLECHPYTGGIEVNNPTTIAKPFELRRTPFHGTERTYQIEFGGGPLRIRYDYDIPNDVSGLSAGHARIAEILDIGVDEVVQSERQVIIPRYLASVSVIYAQTVEGGVTGVSTSTDLIDVNVGGRAWARILL